jgi:hypothetical protein
MTQNYINENFADWIINVSEVSKELHKLICVIYFKFHLRHLRSKNPKMWESQITQIYFKVYFHRFDFTNEYVFREIVLFILR